jgi:hypothetical protein
MALIDPKNVLRPLVRDNLLTLDLNNLEHVNALCHMLRQVRTRAEIEADNAAEQKDQEEEERGDYR